MKVGKNAYAKFFDKHIVFIAKIVEMFRKTRAIKHLIGCQQ